MSGAARACDLAAFANAGAVADEEARALPRGQDLEVLAARVAHALELQPTQLALVHDVVADAVPEGIVVAGQGDGAACSAGVAALTQIGRCAVPRARGPCVGCAATGSAGVCIAGSELARASWLTSPQAPRGVCGT